MAMQIPRLVVVVGFLALCATAAGAPSPDPYTASVAYAKCLRAHGVPHPLPDAKGNFSLTPAEEQRLRRVPRKTRKAAENACFHHLTVLNLKPLSPQALARAMMDLSRLSQTQQQKMGLANRKHVEENYGFDRLGAKFAGALDAALRGKV